MNRGRRADTIEMIRTLFAMCLLCVICGACSSDENGKANENGDCPNVSGDWDITAHCDASFIGMTLQVAQNACQLSFAAPFDSFSGNVTADGKISLSGPQTCTGTVTASDVSMNCTPGTCVVKLAR